MSPPREEETDIVLCTAAEGYTCDSCSTTNVATVIMMANAGDNSRWFCADCLREALALLDAPETDQPASDTRRTAQKSALHDAEQRGRTAAIQEILDLVSELL